MVIARMLLRGGLLTLALASAMAKLLVGLLCTCSARRRTCEQDPSEYTADPPRIEAPAPFPAILRASPCVSEPVRGRSQPCFLWPVCVSVGLDKVSRR
jgi:hypothetical protein